MVLDLLGTRAFLPALCARLYEASTQPIPLDPVILQSILLVLAVGNRKNLILRAVNADEVGIIARIAEWTVSTVFNLPTHRLKVRPSTSKVPDEGLADPAAFLRSLFTGTVDNKRAPSPVSSTYKRRHQDFYSNTRSSPTNSSPFKSHANAFGDPPVPSVGQPHVHYPSPLGQSFSTSSSRAHRRNERRNSHSKPKSGSGPTSFVAATPLIPSALVITGLEHASEASQRALVRVLANGSVTLSGRLLNELTDDNEEESWALPEDFIVIYVTSWEPRERPAIHKTLLDKFAMSTNVIVSAKVKQALRSFSMASSIGTVNKNPFTSPTNSPNRHSHSTHSTPQQNPIPLSTIPSTGTANSVLAPTEATSILVLPADFLPRVQHATRYCTQISPSLNIYLQDLFTAARFDSPELDALLLTAKSMEDAEMLVRACRVLGTELGGWELIRGGVNDSVGGNGETKAEDCEEVGNNTHGYQWEFEAGYDPSGSIAIEIGIEESTPTPEELSASIQKHSKQKEKDAGRFPAPVTLGDGEEIASSMEGAEGAPLEGELMLDVSEADIARIVPRVISHRVRMRRTWRDLVLASAVCGATFSVDVGQEGMAGGRNQDPHLAEVYERDRSDRTVKDALVRILQKV